MGYGHNGADVVTSPGHRDRELNLGYHITKRNRKDSLDINYNIQLVHFEQPYSSFAIP